MRNNLQVISPKEPEQDPEKEKKWIITICLIFLILFLGIKVLVVTFLNVVPEGFFSLEASIESVITSSNALGLMLPPKIAENKNYHWRTLPSVAPDPADNPTTVEKVQLGEMLFFDKNLSADRSLACESCHKLYEFAGADGESVATGINKQQGDRNSPTVWNAAFQRRLFWDGRARSLEEQSLKPFTNPVEMGMTSLEQVVLRVKEQPKYLAAFKRAFADEYDITIEKIAQAIASFERTLITNDSPYDDFVRGKKTALSQQQLNGMALFAKTGCVHCHFGPNFSAASVFDSGLAFRIFPANPSRLVKKYELAPSESQNTVWRVPSLRNVALTGPWLHNGSIKELSEVVRIMTQAQLGRSHSRAFVWSGTTLDVLENPDLSDAQIGDIVAFLESLSSKKLVKMSGG
jgi:cytochrome c peroxidase